MNKVILGVAFVLSLAACQQGQKIAYVDNSKLLDEYQEKKDLEELLKGKTTKIQPTSTRKPTPTTTTHGRRTSYPRRKSYQDGYPTEKGKKLHQRLWQTT